MPDTATRPRRPGTGDWLYQSSPRSLREDARKGLGKKSYKKTRRKALKQARGAKG
jgi:hypothetical protein